MTRSFERFPKEAGEENIQEQRKENLKQAKETVDSWYTAYEQEDGSEAKVGVDNEVKPLLSLLVAMGINTYSSCWGHLPDEERPYHPANDYDALPHIGIEGHLPDREYTNEEVVSAVRDVDRFERQLRPLVDAFNHGRSVPDEVKIELDRFPGMPAMKLRSAGENTIDEMGEEKQRELVFAVRKEWIDFTKFLYKKYLRGN